MAGNQSIVYHYTTQEAAYGIVRDRVLRLSHLLLMEDGNEMRYVHVLLERYLKQRQEEDDPVDRELAGALEPVVQARARSHGVCAACFSTVRDDASQWRLYASDFRGIAIAFRREELETACIPDRLHTGFVEYDSEALLVEIDAAVRAMEKEGGPPRNRGQGVLASFGARVAFVKDPAFAAESEYRIARFKTGPTRLQFVARTDGMLPFASVAVPQECIAEIIVGPRSHPQTVFAWEMLLDNLGYPPHITTVSRSALNIAR